MRESVPEKVKRWSRTLPFAADVNPDQLTEDELDVALRADEENPPSRYPQIASQINYLAEKLYSEYVVTKSPAHSPFSDRLDSWLNSATDEEDQKVLFELAQLPQLRPGFWF